MSDVKSEVHYNGAPNSHYVAIRRKRQKQKAKRKTKKLVLRIVHEIVDKIVDEDDMVQDDEHEDKTEEDLLSEALEKTSTMIKMYAEHPWYKSLLRGYDPRTNFKTVLPHVDRLGQLRPGDPGYDPVDEPPPPPVEDWLREREREEQKRRRQEAAMRDSRRSMRNTRKDILLEFS